MTVYIILGTIISLLIFYILSTYNKLVKRQNRINTQWAQIDVQLTRRADLIPNLVETVKGYISHEKETFESITLARNSLGDAHSPGHAMAANDRLSSQLSYLFATAEAYPDLKADRSFIELQSSLKETEDKIAYARQFYNDAVLLYKDMLQQFPSNIVAKMFNFKDESYYAVCENKNHETKINF